MKIRDCYITSAFLSSLLALGCGQDAVIAPAIPGGSGASFATGRYSEWSLPRNLDPLDTEFPVNMTGFNDQQPALSKDGLTLYFASNRPTQAADIIFDQNIWVAQRSCTSCGWNTPEVLGPNINTNVLDLSSNILDVSPTLSRDEHHLFFASQRPHNHCSGTPPCTNRDLWVSYREDVHDNSGWQPAVNLGDDINTAEEEVAPSYFENADVGTPQLFFNRGELTGDIYMSEMVNGVWGQATLVANINSASADQRPSISHNGLELYFWSNRKKDEEDVSPIARLWVATRDNTSDPWSVPTRLQFPSTDGDVPTLMPFIRSHGGTQTLLFVRPSLPLSARDLWISERTRTGASE